MRYAGSIIRAVSLAMRNLLDTSNRNEHNTPTGALAGFEQRNEKHMYFADLIAKATSTGRNNRINDNTINEVTIVGCQLKKARTGKLLFIADLLIDKSAGKSAGNHSDTAKTPFAAGVPSAEGTQVGEVITLSDDHGPGVAQELVLAGVGVNIKDITPEQLSALVEKVPRFDKDITPNGANAARGLRIRVDSIPYTKKNGQSRFVSKYQNIPQTEEQLKANIARLDQLGLK